MSESDQSKPAAGGDPSMEDILASIRRIQAEEEAPSPAEQSSAPVTALALTPASPADNVLQLDASMMLPDPIETPAPPEPEFTPPKPAAAPPPPVASFEPPDLLVRPPSVGLMGDEPAAAATNAVESLLRTLTTERTTQVYTGGPTLEDIVRAELRPLLKQWLDAYLPDVVERQVRAEIQRVVGRALP